MTIRSSSASLRTKGSKEKSDAPKEKAATQSAGEKVPSAKAKDTEHKGEGTSQGKPRETKAGQTREAGSQLASATTARDIFEPQKQGLVAPVSAGIGSIEGATPVASGDTPVATGNAPVASGNTPVPSGVTPVAMGFMGPGLSMQPALPGFTAPVTPIVQTGQSSTGTRVEEEQGNDGNSSGAAESLLDSLGDPIGALVSFFGGAKNESKSPANSSKISVVLQPDLSKEDQAGLNQQLNDAYNFALSERGTAWDGKPVDVKLRPQGYQFLNSKGQPIPVMATTAGPHLTSMELSEGNSLRMDMPAHEFVHIDQRQIMGDNFELLPKSLTEGEAAYIGYKHAQSMGGSPTEFPQFIKTAYLGSMSSEELLDQLQTKRGEFGYMEELAGALFVDFLDKRYGGDGTSAVKKLVDVEKKIGAGIPFQSAYSDVFKDLDGTPTSYDKDVDLFGTAMAQSEGNPELRFGGTIFQSSWEKAKTDRLGPWAKEYVAMTPNAARDTLRASEDGFNATTASQVLFEFVASRDNLTTMQLLNQREDFFANLNNNQPLNMAFQNSFKVPWDQAVDDFVNHLEDTEDNPYSRLQGTNLSLVSGEVTGDGILNTLGGRFSRR